MPDKKHKGLSLPEGFDPKVHCGAKLRGKDIICMNEAGKGTSIPADLRQNARCYLHGGITGTLKHGNESKIYGRRREGALRTKFSDRIKALKTDAKLLTLEDQIATLKAYIEEEQLILSDNMDAYNLYMEAVRNAAEEGDEMPPMPAGLFPDMKTDKIETLAKLIKTEYDMRFSRRFSIPIEELGAILVQLVTKFNKVAEAYGLPAAAREAFAKEIMLLRTSRPVEDVALMRAGMGPGNVEQAQLIEGTMREVGTETDDAA